MRAGSCGQIAQHAEENIMQFVVTALLAILLAAQAHAATTTDTLLPDGTWKITVDGELLAGDQIEFDRVLFATYKRGVVSSVHLNSPGGLISEGYAFGREIEDQGLTTVVERGAHCESACFLIFVAGTRKIASQDARIGVHRANLNGAETHEGTQDVLDYAYRLGDVEDLEVLHLLAATPSSGMTYLTIRQLRDLGVEVMP
jgi:hypothetical protein